MGEQLIRWSVLLMENKMNRIVPARALCPIILAIPVVITLASPVQAQTAPGYYSGYNGHQVFIEYPQAQPSQFDQMPSYTYDPQLDPANLSPPKHEAPYTRDQGLATASGIDLGLQISDYQYEEPSLNVKLTGPKFGGDILLTGSLGHDWFVTGDIRGAFGFSDYSGSGTKNNNFEDLWDIRVLLGHDFIFETFSLTPIVGVGYRDFYSDDRGTSSIGDQGYRRQNQLVYIPIGIEPRFRVLPDARIAPSIEYDYVVTGEQTSTLSDADVGFPNISNHQKSGYGIRGSLMWEQQQWAAGPFFDYWSIQQSDTVCADGTVYGLCGFEPTNHTIEAGFQVRYHFY